MILHVILLALVTSTSPTLGQECYDDGNEFCIDQADILSVDLLPGSFLLMNQQYAAAENASRTSGNDVLVDGSFFRALDEMDYHRKRMNEYLCHGYMAEEIVKEVGTVRVKRRNEMPAENSISDFLGDDNVTVQDKLLSDEGSTKYKDWLHKTTTLDDIYRHYAPHNVLKKKHEVHEEPEAAEGEIEEFEGELTGYSMPSHHSTGKMGKPPGDHMLTSPTGYGYPSYGPPMHGPPPGPPPMSHHSDYIPTIHEQHIYLPSHDDDEEYHHSPPMYHGKSKGHELTIKDFFEIALTALAFLAFGLFIIQLLMNITNPMTMSSTAATMVTDIDQRFKRSILNAPASLGYQGNTELNEMSHRVLRSIEAILVAQADDGSCLRRLLCEDNRYSRETEGGRRIWIPVWSLGMSWASSRVLTRRPWSATLDSVKASVLGLGGADCAALYPDCALGRERIKRRRRRRKR